MNVILGHKLYRLLHVEEGCVQLAIRGFEEDELNISEEQQQALRNVGVLSISYGHRCVDIAEKFSKIDKTNSSTF